MEAIGLITYFATTIVLRFSRQWVVLGTRRDIRRGIHDRHLYSVVTVVKKKIKRFAAFLESLERELEPRRASRVRLDYFAQITSQLPRRGGSRERERESERGCVERQSRVSSPRKERDHVTKNHITRLPPLFKMLCPRRSLLLSSADFIHLPLSPCGTRG